MKVLIFTGSIFINFAYRSFAVSSSGSARSGTITTESPARYATRRIENNHLEEKELWGFPEFFFKCIKQLIY